MINTSKITKEQFDNVYNKHLPNAFIKFIYKYFSTETEKKDMSLNNAFFTILFILFFGGFVETIFKISELLLLLTVISYAGILAILVLSMFTAVLLNNYRISKITDELGISRDDYNEYADLYE